MNVGHLTLFRARINVTANNFRRHIAHLAENSKVLLVSGHVVVITDEKIARVCIKEEAAVVQVFPLMAWISSRTNRKKLPTLCQKTCTEA